MKNSLRSSPMSMKRRRALLGLLFISPWLIGVTVFFLVPMGQSMTYLFNDVTVEPGGVSSRFVGTEMMLTSILRTVGESALILAFSLFLAIVLSQDFRGRTLSRAIFALPIIVSSGVLLAVFREDLFASSVTQTSDVTIFQSAALEMSMLRLGLDPSLVGTLTGAVSNILDLLWKCGVQILLFLGGIKSVPGQLYEVCSVEGANAWQKFWKVTFPLVTPYILLNAVYSIIDSFTYYQNPVMRKIQNYFSNMYSSSATTLAVAYCLLVLAVTGLVAWGISRRVFYIEK